MAIDFDKAIQFNPNSSSDITLVATSGTNEDAHQFNTKDSRLSVQDKTLTVLLTNLLLTSTEYTFTLPKNFLFDGKDNGNDKYSLTFTTADKITVDISLFSISTHTWYETESTDDGSFNQTITIGFPTEPTPIAHNDSLTGLFDKDLTGQIGNATTPITLSILPVGLSLQISKQATGIQLQITGNATSHQKKIDNTSFTLTLLADFFTFSEDYNPSEITFDFEIIFGNGRWSPRYGHEAFVYDDKIWIVGGATGSSEGDVKNDIWYSDDKGTNWTEVPLAIGTTKWSGRSHYQSFIYDDKIWILGGATSYPKAYLSQFVKNDIWYSEDKGTNWTQVLTPDGATKWTKRFAHQSFFHDDKIWVLGGETGSAENDIWTSDNGGTNWTKIPLATGTAKWSGRWTESLVYEDKIWILGGVGAGANRKNDIWTSDDGGTNWTEIPVATGTAKWSARNGHQSFVYEDKIWVLGGVDGSYKNDIWYSEDKGTNWTEVLLASGTTKWSGRFWHQALVYEDKIWVLGGRHTSGGVQTLKNDIWTSSDGGVTWEQIIIPFY